MLRAPLRVGSRRLLSNLHRSLDRLSPIQNSRDITYLGNDGLSVTAPGPLRLRSWRVGVHWRRGLRHETVTRSDQSVAHGVSTCGYSIILFHRPHTHPTELSPPLGSLPHLRFPPSSENNRADQWSTDPSAASHAASLQPTGGRQCVGRGGPDGEAVANRHSKLSPLVLHRVPHLELHGTIVRHACFSRVEIRDPGLNSRRG